jgi:hypothetical protein
MPVAALAALPSFRSTKEAWQMREVQKIACKNGGGFVMRFMVAAEGSNNDSDYTGTFTNPEYKTINAKDMGLAEGTEIWPNIDIKLGGDRTGPKVRYKANGQVAVYNLTGTSGNSDVQLIGGS